MNTPHPHRAAGRIVSRAGLAACVALLLCAQAQAQSVRKCRIDGRLILQSSPCPVEPRAAVASTVEPTLIADNSEAPPKRTMADVMREREAANRARTSAREPQIDGASILPNRMGAR